MDFLRNGQIVQVNEPWTVFTVYGNFTDPQTGKNFVIVRIPSGRQPWSKKIAPAINRLVRSFEQPKGDKLYWNVEGEATVIEPGNTYLGTDKPIPPTTVRLWDVTCASKYEWAGTALVKGN